MNDNSNIAVADMATAQTLIVQSIKSMSDYLNESVGSRLQKKESSRKLKSNDNDQVLLQKKIGDLDNPFKKMVQDFDTLVTGVTQILNTRTSGEQDDNEKLKKCVEVTLIITYDDGISITLHYFPYLSASMFWFFI